MYCVHERMTFAKTPWPEVGYACQKCQLIIGEGTNELKRLAGHAMATPYTPESIVRSDEPFL